MVDIKKTTVSTIKQCIYLLAFTGNFLTSFCLIYYGLKEHFNVWGIVLFEWIVFAIIWYFLYLFFKKIPKENFSFYHAFQHIILIIFQMLTNQFVLAWPSDDIGQAMILIAILAYSLLFLSHVVLINAFDFWLLKKQPEKINKLDKFNMLFVLSEIPLIVVLEITFLALHQI